MKQRILFTSLGQAFLASLANCVRSPRSAALVLVLTACGGAGGGDVKPAVSSATGPSAEAKKPPTEKDSFRQAYANPGGMWMPSQMALPQHVETFKKMGAALDAKTLADPLAAPLAAVVSLGGCTASFVSPEGLVVTNHHCVQGALQLNSTPKENLVENGFLAKTKADEKSAGPAQRVLVAQAFKDVTKEMRDGLEKITDLVARKDEVEKRQKQLVSACEKDRPGIRCQVSSFFRGGQYQLIEMLEIRDVRLAYVPARSVGNYGGEIDNWEWPRHTGDWSFYRAYVGKDGKPADYSPDNVPYKPKHHLKVSTAGLKPGDFVMITGYPGSTARTATASEIHFNQEWAYPYKIANYKERYAIADSHLKDGGETAIKATVMKQGIQNGLEKFEGIMQGLAKGDLLQQKDDLDKKAKAWAASPGHEQHKAAIDKLETVLGDMRKSARADFERMNTFHGSANLSNALSFTRWAEERVKPDADRKAGYQERDMPRALGGQKQFAKAYDKTLDKESFKVALFRSLKLPEADRPWLPTLLNAQKGAKLDEAMIEKTLDGWYKDVSIEDEKVRTELLQKGTTKDLKASKDPFIQAAQRIWATYKAEEKKADARSGELMMLAPMYVEAMKEALGGVLAPDANSTLRITYGTVRSLKPEATDQANWPFTTGTQLLAKNTGKEPFNSPDKHIAQMKAKNYGPYADPTLGGELPIDFMSDLDITGGNSGSPTLNDKGELVGLAFDGNKEGLASEVVFNPKTTRTIQVDARYMVWTMDAVDGADHLLKEMGIQPKL
jgi:hypothetical protein